jgi:hypothetical protein
MKRTLDTWSRVQHFVEASVAGGDEVAVHHRRLHHLRPSQKEAVRPEGLLCVVNLDYYGTLFRVLGVYSERQRGKEGNVGIDGGGRTRRSWIKANGMPVQGAKDPKSRVR